PGLSRSETISSLICVTTRSGRWPLGFTGRHRISRFSSPTSGGPPLHLRNHTETPVDPCRGTVDEDAPGTDPLDDVTRGSCPFWARQRPLSRRPQSYRARVISALLENRLGTGARRRPGARHRGGCA